jgi:hypothetical protein
MAGSTGSRQDWTRRADRILDAVVPYATPCFARYQLPGPRPSRSGADSDGLEGYARTFLLAAFRIAGEQGHGVDELIERYASGLIHGVNPTDPEAWPRIAQGPNQPMVEAASIALGLHLTRPWLWDGLMSARARADAIGWFSGFLDNEPVPNNWVLFQTIVEEFLATVGAPYREAEITRGLDAIEDWYVGDGWYTDGARGPFDYYNAWAFHLYPLLWTRMAAEGPRAALAAERAVVYRERLRCFLRGYPLFFGADGAPVCQGRSITYRFAAATPLWMGELFDCSPHEPGLARVLSDRCYTYFERHGAFDDAGLLRLGWHGEFLPSVQDYSGPASPYWSSKAFVCLLLPETHPAWTAPDVPLPIERSDYAIALSGPNLLVHGASADGIARLVNHGSDPRRDPRRSDPHYIKFGYSSANAPDAGAEAWSERLDGQLTLMPPEDAKDARRALFERGPFEQLGCGIADDASGGPIAWAGSATSPVSTRDGEPTADLRVESWSFARGAAELRAHRVTAPAGWRLREGGYAVPEGIRSLIMPLRGWTEAGERRVAGANAIGAVSRTPHVSALHPGGTAWFISGVLVTREREHAEQQAALRALAHDVLEGGLLDVVTSRATITRV